MLDVKKLLTNILVALSFKEVTSSFTTPSGQTPSSFHVWKIGPMLFVQYQGPSGAHNTNTTLFTVPSAYRYGAEYLFPFIQNSNTYGIIRIAEDGVTKVNQISSTSNSGRIYFTTFWKVGGGS